jgi:hypothetical protein
MRGSLSNSGATGGRRKGENQRAAREAGTHATETIMTTEKKQRIAFALAMGIVTTGIISFALITINMGFSNEFPRQWLRSWGTSYAIVIPAILVLGPRVQARVNRLIK